MCSILYTQSRNYEYLQKLIRKQLPRGEESFGVINKSYNSKIDTTEETSHVAYDLGAKKMIKHLKQFDNKHFEGGRIIHMRKASVGAKSVKNIHPIKIDEGKFIIQNGTFKDIMNWAKIELNDFDPYRNDTYYIGQYVFRNKSINKIIGRLKRLSDISKLGIIFLLIGDKVLFYSDGARECYVEENDGKIEQISNYVLETKEYETEGWIYFEIETGKIIKKDYETKERVKSIKQYQMYNTSNYSYGRKRWDKHYAAKQEFNNSGTNNLFIPSNKKYKQLVKIMDIKRDIADEAISIHGFFKVKKAIMKIAYYDRTDINNKRMMKEVFMGKESFIGAVEIIEYFIEDLPDEETIEEILYFNNPIGI